MNNPKFADPPASQLHPAFVAALEADRNELNQRFKLACLQGAPLDGPLFQSHLVERVEPIVAAVAACFPERTRLTTRELYQVSLELFRANYWGSETRLPELNTLWQVVMPQLAPLVAREPERVSGSLSNALVNLAKYPVRLTAWLEQLAHVGPQCETVSQLLQVGQVLAWRCGLTLLRNRSLETLTQLPLDLAARSLGLKQTPDIAHWSATLDRLNRDRWFDPAIEESENKAATVKRTGMPQEVREVGRAGDYRGLGGSFTNLPLVYLHDSRLHVSDEVSTWMIEVDCHGCILQRVGDAPAKLPSTRGQMYVDSRGALKWHDSSQTLTYLAAASSQACDGQTLAVTLGDSFHVYLLARV